MAGQDKRGIPMGASGRLFGPVALGLILALAPVTVSVDLNGVGLHQATALAKGDNPGDDKGGDRGGNRGGNGKGNGANANGDNQSLKGQAAKAAARARFNEMNGNGINGDGNVGNGHFVLTDGQTQALLQQGWGPKPQIEDDGFNNHGQRVSAMVHLAKELGYSPSVGAMQANFLPAEWYKWQAVLDDPLATDLQKDEAIAALALLAAELDGWKPGAGPQEDEWATINLDVDGDGVITQADLDAALEGDTPDDDDFFWPEL